MSVPAWAWVTFAAFVLAGLALDLFVLHRRAAWWRDFMSKKPSIAGLPAAEPELPPVRAG